MTPAKQLAATLALPLVLVSAALAQSATQSAPPSSSIQRVIPHGMLLHAPAQQPACSKLPAS